MRLISKDKANKQLTSSLPPAPGLWRAGWLAFCDGVPRPPQPQPKGGSAWAELGLANEKRVFLFFSAR